MLIILFIYYGINALTARPQNNYPPDQPTNPQLNRDSTYSEIRH